MDWKQSRRIKQEYRRAIRSLYGQITTFLGNESDPQVIARRLRIIGNHPDFHKLAYASATRMTQQISKVTAKTWREAARTAGRGSSIYAGIMETLQADPASFYETIRANAHLIRSQPIEVADWIVDKVREESLIGRRAAEIREEIRREYPAMLKTKAQLIARTEVSKTQTALTEARAELLNLPWYIWRTSQDERVRESHHHMKDVLIRWSDPPAPEQLAGIKSTLGNYHAGEAPNDRCYPEPVVRLDLVQFPSKVYYNGRIQRMTQAQFVKIAA